MAVVVVAHKEHLILAVLVVLVRFGLQLQVVPQVQVVELVERVVLETQVLLDYMAQEVGVEVLVLVQALKVLLLLLII